MPEPIRSIRDRIGCTAGRFASMIGRMFDIRRDPVRPLIHVSMTGFWSTDTVDRYGEALGAALAPSLARAERICLLIDATSYPVQSVSVAERFTAMLAQWPAPQDGPVAGVAIIAGSMLNKLQAEHTFGDATLVFLDRDAASEWIDARLGVDVTAS